MIDRFEGELAVIEADEKNLEIPRAFLPETAKEGDVLMKDGENFRVDKEATAKRRAEVLDKIKKLGL